MMEQADLNEIEQRLKIIEEHICTDKILLCQMASRIASGIGAEMIRQSDKLPYENYDLIAEVSVGIAKKICALVESAPQNERDEK